MVEGLIMFGQGLLGFLKPKILFDVLWATQLGIIVGMLPGLTATMGVALMTTLTFKMETSNAVLILVCMYVGAIYGGSRSAILLNIPGTPANAATAVDGYPLARQGRTAPVGMSTRWVVHGLATARQVSGLRLNATSTFTAPGPALGDRPSSISTAVMSASGE